MIAYDELIKKGVLPERIETMLTQYDNMDDVELIVNRYGVDTVNKGYSIKAFNDDGIESVYTLFEVSAFSDDSDAVEAAVKDGVKIIPVGHLPNNFYDRWYGYVDTPENRKRIYKYCKNNK